MNLRPWIDLPLWLPQTNLAADAAKVRRDLEVPDTPVEEAISEACDAFLELGRPPAAAHGRRIWRELLGKIRMNDVKDK